MVSQAKLRKAYVDFLYTQRNRNPFKATKSPQKSCSEERYPVRGRAIHKQRDATNHTLWVNKNKHVGNIPPNWEREDLAEAGGKQVAEVLSLDVLQAWTHTGPHHNRAGCVRAYSRKEKSLWSFSQQIKDRPSRRTGLREELSQKMSLWAVPIPALTQAYPPPPRLLPHSRQAVSKQVPHVCMSSVHDEPLRALALGFSHNGVQIYINFRSIQKYDEI